MGYFLGTLRPRFYNSRSLNQKMVAVVEGITSDGHYDLDVKKSADPKNLSPYIDPWLQNCELGSMGMQVLP